MNRLVFSLMLMCLLVGSVATAQDQDMAAMMEAMEKAAMVGEQHEWLAGMTGSYKVEMKMWMGPGEPSVYWGKSERSMMLGGRVLVESYTSEFMGQEFQGYGMTGYDNVKGEYWATWNDTMSTYVSVMRGECNDAGDTCTFLGTTNDPMTGAAMEMKMVNHFHDDGTEVIDAFMVMPDGSEMKNMELTYTPVK